MKPEVSAGCHQTLSLVGGVWGRDYLIGGPTFGFRLSCALVESFKGTLSCQHACLHGIVTSLHLGHIHEARATPHQGPTRERQPRDRLTRKGWGRGGGRGGRRMRGREKGEERREDKMTL